VLPLLPAAVAAFRAWLAAVAWGPFSTQSLGKSFRRAVLRARRTHPEIPADLRAYDLRHSFLSMILEQTGDLAAVRELGQHASMQTTLRYTQRAASPRAKAAIETVVRQGGTET
jgi:integrase